jgi:hypothetical protein
MTPPMAGKLQELLSQEKWENACQLLRELSPAAAADLIMGLRFEEQQLLFRKRWRCFAGRGGFRSRARAKSSSAARG